MMSLYLQGIRFQRLLNQRDHPSLKMILNAEGKSLNLMTVLTQIVLLLIPQQNMSQERLILHLQLKNHIHGNDCKILYGH